MVSFGADRTLRRSIVEKGNKELFTGEVAKIAFCSVSTVKRYANVGRIKAVRDLNRYRRFPVEEANKLKKLLDRRH